MSILNQYDRTTTEHPRMGRIWPIIGAHKTSRSARKET